MGKSYIEGVQAYEQAHNRHDIQAVMALCTADIRFCERASQSREAVSAALRSVIAWASPERAEVLAGLMPEGDFLYGADTASAWLALLQEWRQGRSRPS